MRQLSASPYNRDTVISRAECSAKSLFDAVLQNRIQYCSWFHWKLIHSYPDCVIDSICNSRHRRAYRNLSYSSHSIWMIRVSNFYYDCVYHGQIKRYRHSVIQEARIHHVPVIVQIVLFVQSPTDTLNHPSLNLTFNERGMNRLAYNLSGSVSQNADFTSLNVHFNINYVSC